MVIPADQFLSFEMACRTTLATIGFSFNVQLVEALMDLRDEENQ
jgi:hypothetical protein